MSGCSPAELQRSGSRSKWPRAEHVLQSKLPGAQLAEDRVAALPRPSVQLHGQPTAAAAPAERARAASRS
eukprot:13574169-Alexandrium_andersonii.AAC.1